MKTYAVMGLDKSGLASVQYLRAKGCRVMAWDDNPAQRERAKALGAEITDLAEGAYDCELVLTPGIGPAHKVAQRFKSHISDIELFARDNPDATVVGITGTNGKSTTTALIHHILKSANIKAEIGGNFGTSPLALPPADVYVIELSSYQLTRCPSLRVKIGIMLNLTPDHLERHGDMQGYAAAKANLFNGNSGTAIYGVDDEYSRAIGAQALQKGWHTLPLNVPDTGQYESFDLTQLPTLPGAHNWQNAIAAILACRTLGLSDSVIAQGLASYPGLAHRQQLVAEHNGLTFINDSKATNADATSKALGCYDNIYWIIGGRAKAGGLNGLEGYIPRIRRAFIIGECAQEFGEWCTTHDVAHEQCGTLDVATAKAAQLAKTEKCTGAVVLLSPACASLDQFKGYEERGTIFMSLVQNLLKGKAA